MAGSEVAITVESMFSMNRAEAMMRGISREDDMPPDNTGGDPALHADNAKVPWPGLKSLPLSGPNSCVYKGLHIESGHLARPCRPPARPGAIA